MKYAVIKSGGKQYVVKEGDTLLVDSVKKDKGEGIEFSDVLMVRNNDEVFFGTPVVTHAKVRGKILENIKGKKIRIAKFRAKTNYRRVSGFRHSFSKLSIDEIRIVQPNSSDGMKKVRQIKKKVLSSREKSA